MLTWMSKDYYVPFLLFLVLTQETAGSSKRAELVAIATYAITVNREIPVFLSQGKALTGYFPSWLQV